MRVLLSFGDEFLNEVIEVVLFEGANYAFFHAIGPEVFAVQISPVNGLVDRGDDVGLQLRFL